MELRIKDGAAGARSRPLIAEHSSARFSYPGLRAPGPTIRPALARARKADPRLRRLATDNSVASHHRVPRLRASSRCRSSRPAAPPGDATAEQMDAIADIADRYSFGEIRVGHEQNLVLPHVAQRDLLELWQKLETGYLAEGSTTRYCR